MIRKLPFEDWKAAQRDLEAIKERVRVENLPHIEPLLMSAQRFLVVEKSPTVAGSELEAVADQLKSHPQLRESISVLSAKLIEYPFAESSALQ